MERSGQHDTLATLSSRKNAIPTEQEAGLDVLDKRKISYPYQDSTPDHPAHNPVVIIKGNNTIHQLALQKVPYSSTYEIHQYKDSSTSLRLLWWICRLKWCQDSLQQGSNQTNLRYRNNNCKQSVLQCTVMLYITVLIVIIHCNKKHTWNRLKKCNRYVPFTQTQIQVTKN